MKCEIGRVTWEMDTTNSWHVSIPAARKYIDETMEIKKKQLQKSKKKYCLKSQNQNRLIKLMNCRTYINKEFENGAISRKLSTKKKKLENEKEFIYFRFVILPVQHLMDQRTI